MIRIRNTNIITFSLVNRKANIQLTPTKEIEVDEHTVFAQRYNSGWSGYVIIKKGNEGYRNYPISVRVAKQITKYLEYNGKDFHYDYYLMPFDKFYFNNL